MYQAGEGVLRSQFRLTSVLKIKKVSCMCDGFAVHVQVVKYYTATPTQA